MDNQQQNLNDYALFCECAERASTFAILTDFLKKGVVEYYTRKSKSQFLLTDEEVTFKAKYQELQAFVNEMLGTSEHQ